MYLSGGAACSGAQVNSLEKLKVVQLKDDLKQLNNSFYFLAELHIYHIAFKTGGWALNGRMVERRQDFWIVHGYIPFNNTANRGMIRKLLCK